jgi:uncharacterized membrane protein
MTEFFIFIIIVWLIILTSAFCSFKTSVLLRLDWLNKEIYRRYDEKYCNPPQNEPEMKPVSLDNALCEEKIKSDSNKIEISDIKSIKDEFKETDFETKAKDEIKDIENLFFGNIFNKIGAVVLIIAFGIFLKFVSQFIEFTPILKIVLALLSGAGMVFGAVYLFKNDKMRNYAAALMGTGFGVLFLTVYSAFAFFHMLNAYTASIAAILLLIFSNFIAKKYKAISTFIIGLIGAYLAPVIINSSVSVSVNHLFSYLIFINLVSMAYVSKDSDKTPFNYANIVLTCLFIHIWSLSQGKPLIILPFILWALYLLFDMLLIKLMPKTRTCLCWVNFISTASYLISNYFESEKYLVSLGTLLMGFVYILCANFIKKYSTDAFLQYKNGSIFALFAAVWFIPSNILKMFMFSIFGALLSFFSKEKEYLQRWGFGFIISSFLMVFSTGALFSSDISDFINYRYIFNERTLFYIIPSLSALSVSRFCKNFPVNLAETLKFFGMSFCYLFIATEINILALKLQNNNITNSAISYVKNISYVILGIIYSLQLRRLSVTSALEIFIYAGYLAFVLSAFCLIIISFLIPDLLYYPVLNIRTFAIIFAIGVSIFYECKEKVNYFGYFAVVLGFLLLNLECYKILDMLNSSDLGIVSTSLWMIYAGVLIISGIFANIKICKLSGIFIVIAGLIKIFFFDIAGVEAVYKIIAFLITGVILMIVSYYYAKRSNN